jgi:hypothetical protein
MGGGQKFWDDFEVVVPEGGGGGSAPLAPPVLMEVVPYTP